MTGATGLVGRVVCRHLLGRGFAVRACLQFADERPLLTDLRGPIDFHYLGDIAANPDWEEAIEGVDAIVHLAARVHVTQDTAAETTDEYRSVNVGGTERLAWIAAQRGVRRLVFASSVKVNGERTRQRPFDEADPPDPQDPYAISKWEAEKALRSLAAKTRLEIVIVRPPLVYGPGVRANFLRLMWLVERGVPLPLPDTKNQRSLIGVENLADFLALCVSHPGAANQTFMVSDGEDVSTRELVARLARALGRSARFLPVPEFAVQLAARLAGKEATVHKLLGSLVISSDAARQRLGWKPPVTLDSGLAATARWYLEWSR